MAKSKEGSIFFARKRKKAKGRAHRAPDRKRSSGTKIKIGDQTVTLNSSANIGSSTYTSGLSRSGSSGGSSTQSNGYEDKIVSALADLTPEKKKELIEISNLMHKQGGPYSAVTRFFKSLPTLDHIIYGFKHNESESNEKNAYLEMAYVVHQYKIKQTFRNILEQGLVRGASYKYKLTDNNTIDFFDLPWEHCRCGPIFNGVHEVHINLSELPEEDMVEDGEPLGIYPPDIEAAWIEFQDNADAMIDRGDVIDESWYIIDKDQAQKNAFGISFDMDALNYGGVSIPPLIPALLDTVRVEEAKARMNVQDALDNAKLLYGKIPYDKSTGGILIDQSQLSTYVDIMANQMPEGVSAFAVPMDVDVLDLSGKVGNQGKQTIVEQHTANLFTSLGLSPILFGNDTVSGEAMRAQIVIAHSWIDTILDHLEAYMNNEFATVYASHGNWAFEFIRTTKHNQDETVETLSKALAFGGSRLKYWAAQGYSPLAAANLFDFEQNEIFVDETLIPKENSAHMGSDDGAGDEGGRPTTNTPTDGTDSRAKNS